MKPNTWTPITLCETSACVEAMWKVGCDNIACVEVRCTDGIVQVRDTKTGEQVEFSPFRWARLVAAVKAGGDEDLANWLFPLVFDAGELSAFRAGAKRGEFDIETT